MTKDEGVFFKKLGSRIKHLRKKRGMTQLDLAKLVNVKQPAIADYEVARVRVSAALLTSLATALDVALEDLLGVPIESRKEALISKLRAQIKHLSDLSPAQQQQASELLKAILKQAQG